MKLFRKLAAAALAGVMALSLLTGCAIGDAAKENAMLWAICIKSRSLRATA